jgi:purine-binding chemotaxis protein CheW
MSTAYLRMRLAGEQYALAVDHVTEVVLLDALTPVPGAPPSVLGLCNLRGEVVSVVDLAAVLGLPGEHHPTRLVVTAVSGTRAGLAIDEVMDVAPLGEITPEHGLGCVQATAIVDDVLLGVLDIGAVLDAVAGVPA